MMELLVNIILVEKVFKAVITALLVVFLLGLLAYLVISNKVDDWKHRGGKK